MEKVTDHQIVSVNPRDLPQYWGLLNEGLFFIRRKLNSRTKWTPAHVKASLQSGQSELQMVMKEGSPVGWFITTVQVDPFLHVPTNLFIWLAYSAVPGDIRGLAASVRHIMGRAEAMGLERIEFLSTRRGWLGGSAQNGLAKRLGFKPVETFYSLSLGGGN